MVKLAVLLLVAAIVMAGLAFAGMVAGVALGLLKILFWVATAGAAMLVVLDFTACRAVA